MLAPYLRTLWGLDRPLLPTPNHGAIPFISELGIHLPEGRSPLWYQAASAHAAAHLLHPRPRLPWSSRTAITRVLIGVLEDTRVERLAMRELPGLRRLWLPFHVATPDLGPGFAPLLARLARALADPAYSDPHPWIDKGRRLSAGLDDADPDALNRAASHLGNDIGQMRLQFNDREYAPSPDYRDDNRWLWQPDAEEELTIGAPDTRGDDGAAPPDGLSSDPNQETLRTTVHPEWDHRIRRTRPAWCTVRERTASTSGATAPIMAVPLAAGVAQVLRQRPAIARVRRPREREGEEFDPAGLVDLGVSRRRRCPIDDRLHLRTMAQRPALALLLLIDTSLSTGQPFARSADSVLTVAKQMAGTVGGAASSPVACAIHAFRSAGRHEVDYLQVKDFADDWDAHIKARLDGLRSAGSTRLGAAIRHGASLLLERDEPDRLLLVLTDGEPHDLDVHEPRYLTEDARIAIGEARRNRIRVGALGLATDCAPALRRMLGPGGWSLLQRPAALPTALGRILASAT
ncbi:hypothetical protein FGG08_007585 [Glutinoglossum americanum]|uniref:VWFA domain-containing protein n=1 Tax=Glutinoglossum americanum TaxID=1670608 RepID=A0A9P8HZ50_9PEZI|nr:hypothetical protein FGG08_007585 [Glutinoglossum americanum]